MKSGVVLLLGALSLLAQPVYEIHGVVADPGFGPVAGVDVGMASEGDVRKMEFTHTATNSKGEFTFRRTAAGRFVLDFRLSGYATQRISGPRTVDANAPKAELLVSMVRLAAVTGRVIDAETREPIADKPVLAMRKGTSSLDPVARWQPVGSLVATPPRTLSPEEAREFIARMAAEHRGSDQNGGFVIPNLPPGDIAVTTSDPRLFSSMRLETGYRAGDHKIVDHEEEPLLWPGGISPDSARPITLGSGAFINIGDILVKKVPRYRAHIRVERGDCPEIESVRLYLLRSGRETPQPQVVPCASDVLLKGLEPGPFTLYAVSDWQAGRDNVENAVWATVPFEVKDEGVEITIVPRRGVVIEGAFRMADEKAEAPSYALGAYVEAPVEGASPIYEEFFEPIGPNQFRMASRGVPATLTTPGRASAYVKEMRYNGTLVRGMKVPIEPGNIAHRLELVLDTAYASLSGTVVDARGIVPQAVVYIQRPGSNIFELGTVSPEGTFSLDRLAPGDYKVSAVGTEASSGSIENNAQSITLRPGAKETLTLRIAK